MKFHETLRAMNQSNQNQDVVAVESNDPQSNPPPSPPYLKLIADCWEQIFDYLSMQDIIAMGQTCRRMDEFAGDYMREYFPNLRFDLIERDVGVLHPYYFHLKTDFCQYISKLYIGQRSTLDFFLDDKIFSSLKTLIFKSFQFNETRFEYMQNVLKNVEHIHIENCILSGKNFKQLAIYCPHLKDLRITGCDITDNALKSLFSQHFPTLEHLQYQTRIWNFDTRIKELKTFLEKHTKLTHFECSVPVLWANRDLLRETNVQLDRFTIDFYAWSDRIPFDRLIDFLWALHERDFYKMLHFSFDHILDIDFEFFDNAICTLPAMEILHINVDSIIDLSRLTSLKELRICHGHVAMATDLEFVAQQLKKLEKLTFKYATIDSILPFIRNSKKLKSIKISYWRSYKMLDVVVLNEERKKLDDIRHVTIYVEEEVYLGEKWKSQNLNLSHVKIARTVSDSF